MSNTVSALIGNFVSAISSMSLYAKDHSAVLIFSEKAVRDISSLFKDDSLSLTILGDSLLCNEMRIAEHGLHIENFKKRLGRKGVEKLIFRKGITPEELMAFIIDLATAKGVPVATQHISVGIVEVGLRQGGGGGSSMRQAAKDSEPKLDEIYRGVKKTKKLDMVGLEEIVSSFISTLKAELNVLSAISPVKTHSEYTFAHTTNVSILTMYQAQSLGFQGDLLREAGLAGLLHDVGKVFVPAEILEKAGKLEPNEWDEMKKHPVYGARYLATLPDVNEIAVIAAFEHHMRFDGKGYPDTLRKGRRQHVISQLVSIADFFDALRTERPYRRSLEIPVIIGLMRESMGKDFNPVLVDNFIKSSKGIFTV